MATFCINNGYLHPGEETSEGQNVENDLKQNNLKPTTITSGTNSILSRKHYVGTSHKILIESKKNYKTQDILIDGIHKVQTRFFFTQIQLTWHN